MPTWYSIPFRPGTIIAGESHPQEHRVERAIEQHVVALLRTPIEGSPGNPQYGCRIWQHLAEPVRGEQWMARFKQDVLDAITTNEPRLEHISVDLMPVRSDLGRNELNLTITGRTIPSDRPFRMDRTVLTDPIRLA